jgi:hypothetical protein
MGEGVCECYLLQFGDSLYFGALGEIDGRNDGLEWVT